MSPIQKHDWTINLGFIPSPKRFLIRCERIWGNFAGEISLFLLFLHQRIKKGGKKDNGRPARLCMNTYLVEFIGNIDSFFFSFFYSRFFHE